MYRLSRFLFLLMLEVRGVSLAQKRIIMKKESELFFGLLSLCLVVCLSACRSGDDEPSLEDGKSCVQTWGYMGS